MVYAEQLFNGADGSALGNLAGTWTWQALDLDAAGSALVSTAESIEGGSSARYSDACTNATYGDWSVQHGDFYGRVYMKMPAAPQNGFTLAKLFGNTWASATQLVITTDRRIGLRTSFTGTDEASEQEGTGAENFSSANVVPTGAFCRIEWYMNGPTDEARLFTGANVHGTTPDVTINHAPAGYVGLSGLQVGPISMGPTSVVRPFAPVGQHIYLEALRVDSIGWVGPLSGFSKEFAGIIPI